MKPKIFIGSSREGLDIARAVELLLTPDAEVTLWNEGVFGLNYGTLESLVNKLSYFDFSILVLTPDDVTHSRGAEQNSPRDNVLLELGLFLGHLGRDRTFIVLDPDAVKIPTDLAGVTLATYSSSRQDGNLTAALSPTCTIIRGHIRTQGLRPRAIPVVDLASTRFRDRSELVSIREMAENALEVWACGVTLISLVTIENFFLEQKLRLGCKLRFLLLDPSCSAMAMWHEGRRFATPADSDSSLRLLAGLAKSSGNPDSCEIRLSKTFPPFSLVVSDPHSDEGAMNLEVLAFKMPLAARPHVHLRRKHDPKWFDFFVSQFEELWLYGQDLGTTANPADRADD
jgi:Predicted nucleotide-binding protein containing TIR-like domain